MKVIEKLKEFFNGRVPGEYEVPQSAQDAEQELLGLLMDRWQAAQAGGNQAHEKYDEYLQRWRQKHNLKDRAEWRSQMRTRADFASIRTQISLMTANLPMPQTEPADDPRLAMLAPAWDVLFSDWWEQVDGQAILEDGVLVACLNSNCDFKIGWDIFAAGGEGAPSLEVKDPREVYLDHEATSFRDARYIFEICYATPEEMEAIFGARARGLSSQGYGAVGGLGVPSEATAGIQLERIRYIRCWWKDYTRVEVRPKLAAQQAEEDLTDPEGPAPLTVEEDPTDEKDLEVELEAKAPEEPLLDRAMKYPTGRVTTFTDYGSSRILDDRANPYPWLPFIRLDDYRDPHMATGVAEMDLTAPMSDAMDTFMANTVDVSDQCANPKLVGETNMGLVFDQLTGASGETIIAKPGTSEKLRWISPPPVQEWILRFPELVHRWFQGATGVQDVLQGQRPPGLNTFATLRALQESGMSAITPKSRRLDRVIREIGERFVYMAQTRYHTARKLAIAGDAAEKLLRMLQDEQGQPMQENLAFVAQNSGFPDASAYSRPPEEVLQFLGRSGKTLYFSIIAAGLRGAMRIKVERGNLIAKTQAEIEAVALQLAQTPVGPQFAIDRRALLDTIRFPNRDEIITRMEQQQAAMMAQAAPAGKQAAGPDAGFAGAPGAPGQQAPVETSDQRYDLGVLSPAAENVILAEGKLLITHPGEDDEAVHAESHRAAFYQATEEAKPFIQDHIEQHQSQAQQQEPMM